MAGTIVNTQTYQSSSSPTIVVTKPTSLQDGDVLIGIVGRDNDSPGAMSYPAAWTQIDENITVAGRDQVSGIYYKIVTDAASEAADYTWFWNGANEQCAGMVTAVRGLNATSQHDVHAFVLQENKTDPTTPSITTSQDEAFVVTCLFSSSTSSVSSFTAPGGVTKIVDITEANHNLAVGWFTETTAGATGSQAWNPIDSLTSDDWHAYTFSFHVLLGVTPTSSESVPIGLIEFSHVPIIDNGISTDTIAVGLSEVAIVSVIQSASDTLPVTLIEVTQTQMHRGSEETLTLGWIDGSPVFVYTLDSFELLPIIVVDGEEESTIFLGLFRLITGTLTTPANESSDIIRARP
jgi:hypothetical protein